ncbi:DNA internalization-related competence protein ComEC/Rec2 [Bacillus sp. ISL-35]|uniref:DNA internalization-related competence protein ComEC/Rec2 n=1 Tax=Bacillus sp. ISL-35 TaxID=2819122 RepID=UPI001BE7DFF1|nr:DNA internalization-related competence protein ComEC/Rec2 [Bacillus sp. ISL-35]MBT2677426.1 DNA internalization-related competence protein ComEC/Rec2 [Bacillus sp. ISL-35]MBT2702186.1 DNA internalization-related competence protein ComEC/Rec2 [Chryseobacterium sp. ISL-80]
MKFIRIAPIRGRLLYFAAVSLLGLLTMKESPLLYGALFLLVLFLLYKVKKLPASLLVLMTGCYAVFSAAGYFDGFETVYTGSEKNFLVLFDDEIKVDGDLLYAYSRSMPANEKLIIKYRIKTIAEKEIIQNLLIPGTACSASGVLSSPSPATNPNAFDYKKFLERDKISWILEADMVSLDTCQKKSKSILTLLRGFRQEEVLRINKIFLDETSALMAALIFGERDLFNPETERSYQKIGIVHLLAISGLHVGLLTGMLYFISIRLGVTKEKTEMMLMVFLPLYAIMTGLAPPVVRAAALLLLLIGSKRFSAQLNPLDAISTAFMIMALLQPGIIYDTGFQLSYSVSFSLILSAPVILKSLTSFAGQTAAASLVAQASSLPIIISSFHEVSVISILANLLFVPLFSFGLLPLLLLSYISFLLGSPPSFYLGFLEKLIHNVNLLAVSLSELPITTLVIGRLEPILLILNILLILIFFYKWEGFVIRKSKPPLWIFALPILPLFMQILWPYLNPYGKIVFLDVGQGDSIFIRLPHNQGNYLIDTGGVIPFAKEDWQQGRSQYDPGKKIVVPFLKSEGIRSLDKLILTHGDADHIGGAAALFDEMDVKQLIIPRVPDQSELEKRIIDVARKKGTEIHEAKIGTGWSSGGGDFLILNPNQTPVERNDGSIVLLANIGGKKWLFTGDLGLEGERLMEQTIKGLDIDVLKVGHHGSKYSSSEGFLEWTKPEYGIISVGRKNRYGHPGKEVLQRLEEAGVVIYRTDEDGAIIYNFKSNSGTFAKQLP